MKPDCHPSVQQSQQLAQRHALLPGQQRLLQELRFFPV